jgi:hypothetical protein
MNQTSLSIRLTEGDLFIHLEKESFSRELRTAIKAQLPEMIVTPITDERMSFLRRRCQVTHVFSTPFHSFCPIVVETAQQRGRSSAEISTALRGVITAFRHAFPSSAQGERAS